MNESAGGEEDVAVPLLLKTLEDILYNIITQKKVETHKTQNRADTTDKVWRDRNIAMSIIRILVSEDN
jgi:hypothetical protein